MCDALGLQPSYSGIAVSPPRQADECAFSFYGAADRVYKGRYRVIAVAQTKGVHRIPKLKEFTVTIEDKPGALGTCFRALAERGINVLAFQSYVEEGESLARLLVDDPPAAKSVLGRLGMIFEETEVAAVRLAHRPGELARATTRLGEHKINIDYSYSGLEPGSTTALVVFGVDNLSKAATALDELAGEEV